MKIQQLVPALVDAVEATSGLFGTKMITKQDCIDPICFFCRENIIDRDVCCFITKGKINYQKFDDPKYMVINGYWKEKCSTPIIFSTVAFHEKCFIEIAGDEYQFDEGTPEDPLIIL